MTTQSKENQTIYVNDYLKLKSLMDMVKSSFKTNRKNISKLDYRSGKMYEYSIRQKHGKHNKGHG